MKYLPTKYRFALHGYTIELEKNKNKQNYIYNRKKK